jgi:hypothetical protein
LAARVPFRRRGQLIKNPGFFARGRENCTVHGSHMIPRPHVPPNHPPPSCTTIDPGWLGRDHVRATNPNRRGPSLERQLLPWAAPLVRRTVQGRCRLLQQSGSSGLTRPSLHRIRLAKGKTDSSRSSHVAVPSNQGQGIWLKTKDILKTRPLGDVSRRRNHSAC